MSQQVKLGGNAYVDFTLYEADGITPWAGQEGVVTTALVRNGVAAALAVTITPVAGQAGRYVAIFVPDAIGTYTLTIRHVPSAAELAETVQVNLANIDDVAAAAGLTFDAVPS